MNVDALVAVAFLAGLTGSTHCLGMCGPVVVLFERQRDTGRKALRRRVIYNLGRLGFYLVLGASAGALGTVIAGVIGIEASLAALRIAASLVVVALGLSLALDLPVFRYLETRGAALWRMLSPLTRHVLPVTSAPRALAAGFLWGALPCGLVYGAVAIAATSGTGQAGATVMLAFWMGTLPALLFAGASAKALSDWSRRPALRRGMGAALVAVGAISLALPLLHQNDVDGHAHHTGMQHQSNTQP